jgi:hypothetical protein
VTYLGHFPPLSPITFTCHHTLPLHAVNSPLLTTPPPPNHHKSPLTTPKPPLTATTGPHTPFLATTFYRTIFHFPLIPLHSPPTFTTPLSLKKKKKKKKKTNKQTNKNCNFCFVLTTARCLYKHVVAFGLVFSSFAGGWKLLELGFYFLV